MALNHVCMTIQAGEKVGRNSSNSHPYSGLNTNGLVLIVNGAFHVGGSVWTHRSGEIYPYFGSIPPYAMGRYYLAG